MTRAEAEAAVVAAEQDLDRARGALRVAQAEQAHALRALGDARDALDDVRWAETFARMPRPVWLVAPADGKDRRVDAVSSAAIELMDLGRGPREHSRSTGFRRWARGAAKAADGQLDVAATLAAWAAAGREGA